MSEKSETKEKRTSFKDYSKQKYQQAKEYGGKQVKRAKEYGNTLKDAYNVGYKDGWAAHEKLPKTRGSHTAAVMGYNNGMRNHKKSDKYSAKMR